jgi:hypothetical protein
MLRVADEMLLQQPQLGIATMWQPEPAHGVAQLLIQPRLI